MIYYFKLELIRIERIIRAFGLHPIVVLTLLPIIFVVASYQILDIPKYGVYIYPVLAALLIGLKDKKARQQFLRKIFPYNRLIKIKIIENTILSLPFTGFLIYQNNYLIPIAFQLIMILLAFWSGFSSFSVVIPTPFRRKPFEFIVGFRKSYAGILLSYILTYIAIKVDNFSMGIFALLLVFLICMSFFNYQESKFYLWTFAGSSKSFIHMKLKNSIAQASILSLPIFVSLGVWKFSSLPLILSFGVLGLLYIVVSQLGKYAYYPSELNLISGMIIGLCVIFPPALIVVIPAFYQKSIHKLSLVLT